MTKKVCIFGSLFQEARSQTALSQWEISVRAGTHLSNVNQVEAGNQEPNVILAVKMLLAVNADIQSFFMELASLLSHCIENSIDSPKRISGAVEFRSDTTRRSGNFWNAPFAM